jgi:hypothetical protein
VAGEVLLVTQFLAAGLMLLLAGWLLYLNFHSRVVRAFSLFLFVRAMGILSNQLGRVMEDPFGLTYWLGVRGYYLLAVVPALGYFLLVYTGKSNMAWKRLAGWALVVLTIVIEIAHAVDHCVAYCEFGEAPLRVGPLGILTFGIPLAFALAAIVLFVAAMRAPTSPQRAGAVLAGAVFLLNSLVETSLTLSYAAGEGLQGFLENFTANTWQWVPLVLPCLAGVAFGAAFVLLVRGASRHWTLRGVATLAVLSALAIGTGLLLTFASLGDTANLFILGTWRLSLPIVVSVAILRHRLFGLDWRIKVGISRALVAGALLAAFFAVSKITENLVAELFPEGNVGIYAGGIVAGLLLFAISPLQKVAERIAQAAVPTPSGMDQFPASERVDFYRDQAQIAWSDGVLGHRERLLLDRLRDRLGLAAVEAARIESEAARKMQAG